MLFRQRHFLEFCFTFFHKITKDKTNGKKLQQVDPATQKVERTTLRCHNRTFV